MTIQELRLHRFSALAVQVSACIFIFCGLGEWIVWDWLKAVPCAANSIIEWKGLSKCVTEVGAVVWRTLDYGTKGAFVGTLLSLLLSRISQPRER
jgi:hypothetical protein